MRQLTGHIVNPANDKIDIFVRDDPGAGGAHHYLVFDPPVAVVVVFGEGLGEDLIAIAGKRGDIDIAAADRPEAATAGFVGGPVIFVCRGGETALTGKVGCSAAVGLTVMVDAAGEEGFEDTGFGAGHLAEVGELDDPLAVQVLARVFV